MGVERNAVAGGRRRPSGRTEAGAHDCSQIGVSWVRRPGEPGDQQVRHVAPAIAAAGRFLSKGDLMMQCNLPRSFMKTSSFVQPLAAALLLVAASSAYALDVLGMTLSGTTRQTFLDRTKGDSTLVELPATDRFTVHGYILRPEAKEYPGLKRAGFMFDPSDRLCMIIIELPLDQFDKQVQVAKKSFQLAGSSSSPNGAKDAYFHNGTNRISIEALPQRNSTTIMYMNEAYKADSDARIRSHGMRPKYD